MHTLGRWSLVQYLSAGLFSTVLTVVLPAQGAERVNFSYWGLERSISVASIEAYAREGRIERDLAPLIRRLGPEQRDWLRRALLPTELSAVSMAQFLYSPQGEVLLEQLGQLVQSKSGQSGFWALRAALILAADDAEGLTLLNILRRFPLKNIQIDVPRTLHTVRAVGDLVNQTQSAIAAIEHQTHLEAAQTPLPGNFDLRQLMDPGPFRWEQTTLELYDHERDRPLLADLYLPLLPLEQYPQPVPVIVISHSLGSDRTTFAYLSYHLASHGFAVLVPEHVGSNARQLQALLQGKASEIAEPEAFINRPLDVTYLLDVLAAKSQFDPKLQGRLDWQRVGIIGQSLGGYTALAVAGAPINVSRLQTDCQAPEEILWNPSLLLQCRALAVAESALQFRDPRIQGAIALNPITSSVFGEASLSQIQIPLMVLAGGADTVAPALIEQIRPFTWLTTPDKYLVLLKGATHFSALGESGPASHPLPLLPQIVGPDPVPTRRSVKALSLAFLQAHIANRPEYLEGLRSSAVRDLSQLPRSPQLVRSLSATQLQPPARSRAGMAQNP